MAVLAIAALLRVGRLGPVVQRLESRVYLSGSAGTVSPAQTSFVQTIAHLSQARSSVGAAAVGNKVLFAGGLATADVASDVVDIYDVKTGQWSIAHLSQPRFAATTVTVGDKVLVAGGTVGIHHVLSDVVDIYDDVTGHWSATQLPHADSDLALAVGSKVIFVGGQGRFGHGPIADIYDAETGSWITSKLPLPAYTVSGAYTGVGIRQFAVGHFAYFLADGGANVYDTLTGGWTAAALPQSFFGLYATSGSKLILAGRNSIVRTYELYTGEVRTGQLFTSTGSTDIGSLGGKIIFAGEIQVEEGVGTILDRVDVYDTLADRWSNTAIPGGQYDMGIAKLGGQAFFAGGLVRDRAGATDVVNIFTDATPAPVLDGYLVRGDTAGSATTASVTMRNTGDDALAGPFTVTIYGARTGRRSVALGTVTVRRALRVGESRTITVRLMGTPLADYLLSAATDAGAGQAVFAGEVEPGHFTRALLPVARVTQSDKSTALSIIYHSPFNINVSTLDDIDIIVTGPNGFEARVQFVSQRRVRSHRSTWVATYVVHAAGRRWDVADNGVYSIHLQDGEVMDVEGNAAPSGRVGTFVVDVNEASPSVVVGVARKVGGDWAWRRGIVREWI
jgi:hypothetical protein